MPSIDGLEIIQKLLRNNGVYPGDPQALQLSQYTNNWGGITYHIAMNEQQVLSLLNSPYCHNITTLWYRKTGLTLAGEIVLAKKDN